MAVGGGLGPLSPKMSLTGRTATQRRALRRNPPKAVQSAKISEILSQFAVPPRELLIRGSGVRFPPGAPLQLLSRRRSSS